MYDLFEDFVNKVFLTEVFADVPGDAFFKLKFPSPVWRTLSEIDVAKNNSGDEYNYRFSIKERRNRKDRYEFVSRFFTDAFEKDKWLSTQINTNRPKIQQYVHENLTLDV